MAEDTIYTCTTCNGQMYVDGKICSECFGSGSLPLVGNVGILKIMSDKLNDVIAEQSAQRTDLTTALTAIWNKVKNL